MQKFAITLKHERMLHSWSQGQVAEYIGTTAHNVSRWERDVTYPSPYFRQRLCELFGKTAEELGFVSDRQSNVHEQAQDRHEASKAPVQEEIQPSTPQNGTLPRWNIPHRRNPFFTGREAVLARLHTNLRTGKVANLTQAICGLGGIGKTQTAIEYAYRYQDDYTLILWARAETYEVLTSDFIAIATILNLPEMYQRDQRRVVEAVKNWLNEHEGWLLILDNVEDFSSMSNFLPASDKGHLLLTTRNQSTAKFGRPISLESMEPGEGALFLLRRARLLEPTTPLAEALPADRTAAETLSRALAGLPLALDQAGAYIEETGCRLADYLDRYQSRQAALLQLRGGLAEDHPQSVSTTFSLSFKQIEQKHPAAAEVLYLGAFLHPDAIPEEILTEGAPDLGSTPSSISTDSFALDIAFATLRTYSLIRRHAEAQVFTIHRLVQAVLKERMDEETQRQWAERTVRAVARTVHSAYSDSQGSRGLVRWERCQRCLPHALLCMPLIEQWQIETQEAGQLLQHIGAYLHERAQYAQAELCLQQALAIRSHVLGTGHPDVAATVHDLALLYLDLGRYAQTEPLFLQALSIHQTIFGNENADVATSLNDLGVLYYLQGKYTQALQLTQQSLDIRKRILGSENVLIAESLNNLAVIYHNQAHYAEAEHLLQQSLAIAETTLKLENPQSAFMLDNLARLYRDLGKYTQSEALFIQTLAIRERLLGQEHPLVAQTLSNMARLRYYEGRYALGIELCQRALTIWQHSIGHEHPRCAQALHNLALLYHSQGDYEQARSFYKDALVIREEAFGRQHPKTTHTLSGLAQLLSDQGELVQAEALFEQVLHALLRVFNREHPRIAEILHHMALLAIAQQRDAQALSLLQEGLAIREKVLGTHHPATAQSLHALATFYARQGQDIGSNR